jgi:hypothetical protein
MKPPARLCNLILAVATALGSTFFNIVESKKGVGFKPKVFRSTSAAAKPTFQLGRLLHQN